MANVLVTDGEQRAALATVRSLGRAGHRVFVCSHTRRSVSGGSRRSSGEAMVANALAEPQRFVADVADLIRRWQIDVLVPISDASLTNLLPVEHELGAVIPFGSLEAYEALSDKQRVLEAAAGFGIAVPRQRTVESRAELIDAARPLRFPLVLKPTSSVREDHGAFRHLEVAHVLDDRVLLEIGDSLPDAAFPLLAQERIVGPGTGVFLLVWEDVVLATFAHRRLREKPPSGGETVYTESIATEPALLDACVALVRSFGWSGALMIEFKVDARTGLPYLMEINARFWAGLQLAIDAGVDFPALLVDAALGVPRRPKGPYRVGTRVRWFWGDVDHLVARLIRSRARLNLPSTDVTTRRQAMRAFVETTLSAHPDAVFRRDDPGPFVRETWRWLLRR